MLFFENGYTLGHLKKKGWLFWATFCTLNVVLCILCTPLLKTLQNMIQEKSQDNSCKPFFFAWRQSFLRPQQGLRFTYIRIGYGRYDSGVDQSPSRVRVLVLLWQDPENVSVDQTLKYSGQIIDNLNRALLQSMSAALGGSARSGDFLQRPPTPRAISPLGRATVPAFVMSQHTENCMYECLPPQKQCGLCPRFYGGTSLPIFVRGRSYLSDTC